MNVDPVALLQRHRKQLASELDRIDAAIAALNGSGRGRRKKTRTMSAAGRARIAAAQRARWAKVKAAKRKAA